ncbi:hypothetical protein BaRGS_00004145 [Batillaria attramentaria]|uniref:Craniofacial development protein 1 n=1 Tax=Batillaria attramentaria TaxID=370345 RepID=A0ABD0LYY2_9CAEN
MSDEEDYNSEEDADYVPSDGELGSEEENSGDEEDLTALTADGEPVPQTTKRTRGKKNKTIAPRKRKGGIKLEGEEIANKEEEDPENRELAEKLKEEAAQKKAETEKKRVDDLWASFQSAVTPSPRRPPPSGSSLASVTAKVPGSQTGVTASGKSETSTQKSNGDKVTITKVFDFAGEEIKITKEVDVNSKEAKAELKKQQNGIKRPASGTGGLSGVLSKIGKKQKMGTLEKSKLDWDSFKRKEGIEEDLKIHNKGKDGYIERMAFLNRADVRQFEIERDLRLSKSGKR